MKARTRIVAVALGVGLVSGCWDFAALDRGHDGATSDAAWDLPTLALDGGADDQRRIDMAVDLASSDLSLLDLAMPDLRVIDLAMRDVAVDLPLDLRTPDFALPDLSVPDLSLPDLSLPDLSLPDLSLPDLADGGADLATGCAPGFADCDNSPANGCETNLLGDANNCGGCGTVCSINGVSTRRCTGGACTSFCSTGFADCDGNKATDGCEVNTTSDPAHCGGCTMPCSTQNITAGCVASTCQGGTCLPGFADCDGDKRTNGCETDLGRDPANCGACHTVCSSSFVGVVTCTGGRCDGPCATGHADCDNDKITNGCETPTTTLANCGGCGKLCAPANATGTCTSGSCAVQSCNMPYADCDANPSNGCEQSLYDADNCGACGTKCSSAHVGARSCTVGVCDGSCSAGFADCDGDKLFDGCETDLGGDLNCGGCGVNCGPTKKCIGGVCKLFTGYPCAAHSDCQSGACSHGLCARSILGQTAVAYEAGSPIAVAIKDLNGDNKNDVLVTNSAGLNVLLGKGDGTLQAPVVYGTGRSPHGMAFEDFNVDGRLDVVVANFDDNTVSVLLGKGDGTFAAQTAYPAPSGVTWVTAADFQFNGAPDFAASGFNDNRFAVYLSNGAGGFSGPTYDSAFANNGMIAQGDINLNGQTDLVIADGAGNGGVLVFNSNAGSFGAGTSYPAGGSTNDIVVRDLNNDGKPDVVAANYAPGQVTVLLGNGNGTLRNGVSYAAGSSPQSPTLVDWNGDGYLDLAVSNRVNPGTIAVLAGVGDGTFRPPVMLAAPPMPFSIAPNDLDGDGRPDLALTTLGSTSVYVILNSSQ